MTDSGNYDPTVAGVAALSICESLLLALGDLKVLSEEEVVGIVSDAAGAHRFATGAPDQIALHQSVAALLDKLLAGGNSVRRT